MLLVHFKSFPIFICFLLFDLALCTYVGLEEGVPECSPQVGQMLCLSGAKTPGPFD